MSDREDDVAERFQRHVEELQQEGRVNESQDWTDDELIDWLRQLDEHRQQILTDASEITTLITNANTHLSTPQRAFINIRLDNIRRRLVENRGQWERFNGNDSETLREFREIENTLEEASRWSWTGAVVGGFLGGAAGGYAAWSRAGQGAAQGVAQGSKFGILGAVAGGIFGGLLGAVVGGAVGQTVAEKFQQVVDRLISLYNAVERLIRQKFSAHQAVV